MLVLGISLESLFDSNWTSTIANTIAVAKATGASWLPREELSTFVEGHSCNTISSRNGEA